MNDHTALGLTHALTAVTMAVVLWAITRGSGASGEARLRYSGAARVFALFAFAPVVLVPFAVTFQKKPLHQGELKAVIEVLALFFTLGTALALEFFRVNHHYDDAGWSYRSPWSAHRRLNWANVARVEWRPLLKWLDFVPTDGTRFHVSPLLGGLDGFARVALSQIPAYVLTQRPEAHAVLRLMAAGHASKLVWDAKRPRELVAELLAHPDP